MFLLSDPSKSVFMHVSIPTDLSLISPVGFSKENGELISHSGDCAATQNKQW